MSIARAPRRKEKIGTVLSNNMQKTVIVRIERLAPHPQYRKVMRQISKIKAHDENGVAKVGDKVRLAETRPISREKRWRVVEVLKST